MNACLTPQPCRDEAAGSAKRTKITTMKSAGFANSNTLNGKNFVSQNIPPSFYATPELTQRLHLISHLIQHSEQLLLLLAEKGCGKTTLLNQLVLNADERWKVFTPTGGSALTEKSLLHTLLAGFNVRADGKSVNIMRETLRSHIAASRYNGLLPVLLVDDAHMLPLETLAFLVRLVMTGETQTRMHVVLLCEPQITSIFAAPEFEIMRNTLIHTLDIPPFSEKQIGAYLQSRFGQGKYSNNNPFTEKVISTIYHESEGVPGKAAELADIWLQNHNRQQQRSAKPRRTAQIIKIMGTVLIFVFFLFVVSWIKNKIMPDGENGMKPLTLPEKSRVETSVPLPVTTDILPDDGLGETPVVEGTAVSEEILPVATDISNGDLGDISGSSPAAAVEAVEKKDTPSENPPVLYSAEDLSDLSGVYSAAWLGKQDPALYTIQILGTYEKTAVTRFLGKYPLDQKMAIFSVHQNNKIYHKLVYGFFNGREAAKSALENLPKNLRDSTKPWLRTVGNIQDEIKNQN